LLAKNQAKDVSHTNSVEKRLFVLDFWEEKYQGAVLLFALRSSWDKKDWTPFFLARKEGKVRVSRQPKLFLAKNQGRKDVSRLISREKHLFLA